MSTLSHTKRITYATLGIISLVVIGYVLYSLLPAPLEGPIGGPQTITGRPIVGPIGSLPGGEQPTGGIPLPDLPSIAGQKLFRLTDFPVISPVLNKDQTKILFYKKAGGDLFASDFIGKTQEKLTNLTVIGLIEAIWNRTGDRAILRYLDGDTIKAFLQVGTSSITVLPQDITSGAWSPDGGSLAYTLPRDGRLDLVVADARGQGPRTIYRSPLLDATIAWPATDLITFETAPSAFADGFIFSFSRSNGSLTKIFGPRFGLTGLWSPNGISSLASFLVGGGQGKNVISLALYDRVKKISTKLGLTTLSEKCAWAGNESVFCAVPREVPSQTVLPDEYLRGEFNPIDRIVEITLATQAITPVFEEGDFDMANLVIAQNKKNLFFVNRRDGTLWSLKLE